MTVTVIQEIPMTCIVGHLAAVKISVQQMSKCQDLENQKKKKHKSYDINEYNSGLETLSSGTAAI